jgi:hypothetical protein
MRIGLTARRTVTVKEQEFELPHASCAVATTMFVVSIGKAVPEGGEEVTVTLLQTSEAIIDQVTMTFVSQVNMTMLLGQVICGGVVSCTVMVCEHSVLKLVQQSLAFQVRVTTRGQAAWLVTVLTVSMVGAVGQQSLVAVGWSNDHDVPHWTVLLDEQVMVGGADVTVTVLEQYANCPRQLVYSQKYWITVGQDDELVITL